MNTYKETQSKQDKNILPASSMGNVSAFYFQDNRAQAVLQQKIVNELTNRPIADLPVQHRAKTDLTDSTIESNAPVDTVQLFKKKAKKKKKAPYHPPADIQIGTAVNIAQNIIGPEIPLTKGTAGVVESFSKSKKTAMVKITSKGLAMGQTVRVNTTDIRESTRFDQLAIKEEAASNQKVLTGRLKNLDNKQNLIDRKAFAKPHNIEKAQRLTNLLKLAPLTINVRVSDLAKYTSPEVLNGFEVMAKRGGDHTGVGNISDDKLKKRYYYEHQTFGFPYPYADTKDIFKGDSGAAETPQDSWGAGHMGPSALDGKKPKYTNADPSLRPRYGALDFRNSGKGATPDPKWYGTSYIELKNAVKSNCTFSLGDTWDIDLDHKKDAIPVLVTAGNLDLIIIKMMNEDSENPALTDLDNRDKSSGKVSNYEEGPAYIEAQIHQPILFSKDVNHIYLSLGELTEAYKGDFDGSVKSAKKCVDPSGKWSSKVKISLIQ